MNDWKEIASAKPVQAYSIFCGVLEYDEDIFDEIKSGNTYGFNKWEPHVNPNDIDPGEILKNFNRYYYESFVNCIFPGKMNKGRPLYDKEYAEKTIRLSHRIDERFPHGRDHADQ